MYLFQQLSNIKFIVQAMEKITAVRGNPALHFFPKAASPINNTEDKARFLHAIPTCSSIVAQNRDFKEGFAMTAQIQLFWRIFPFCHLFMVAVFRLAPSS